MDETPDPKCATCGHKKSQHIDAPRMCADCARDNEPNAFHGFQPAADVRE